MRIFCSICKELFTLFVEVCITKCGHLYHENCLQLWQERNPSCPQCRTKIVDNPGRVYFNTEDVHLDSQTDTDSLKARIDNLLETTAELKVQNKELESSNANLKDSIAKYEEKAKMNKEVILMLQGKVDALKKEKEDLLPLRVINEDLKAELKRKTELDTLLKGTEKEVREMLSKTPVTSLAVHQLCVYVEALKHQLRKCEENYQYKNEIAVHMQRYQTSLKESKAMMTTKSLKANKTTNTLGNMCSDSEEENEVHEGKNLKRPSTSSLEYKPELKLGVTNSDGLFKSENKMSEKLCGKSIKRVINNLGNPDEIDFNIESSNIEVQVYPGSGKIKLFKSSSNSSRENGIFGRLMISEGGERSGYANAYLDVARDAWSGRRINPLQTSAHAEKIKRTRERNNLFLKNSR